MCSLRTVFIVITLVFANVDRLQSDTMPPDNQRIDTINYVLGTQTFGIKYKFTDRTGLVETAERIHEMGSNILKFGMSTRCMGDHYNLPKREDIRSLVDLARKEPSVKAVLDMPFAYYHIWAYPFANSTPWHDGLSEKERRETYEEVHALARYLLKTYSGTGKTFFLGHWEGDWHLLSGYDPKLDPTPAAIKGMTDWLNVRQKAVDDAKRQARVHDVYLYHYTEVNLVQKGMKGGKCLVNDVLPYTKVDYVSYSSYDTINPHRGNVKKALHDALDYIESKLPPKAGIRGKRVVIGEYGFSLALVKTPQTQDRFCRDVCLAALEWGSPFVLYWEMYCNENPGGKHRGFWLIDDRNRKQPFYHTLQDYYRRAMARTSEYARDHGRLPTDNEFQKMALDILKQELGSEQGAPLDTDIPLH